MWVYAQLYVHLVVPKSPSSVHMGLHSPQWLESGRTKQDKMPQGIASASQHRVQPRNMGQRTPCSNPVIVWRTTISGRCWYEWACGTGSASERSRVHVNMINHDIWRCVFIITSDCLNFELLVVRWPAQQWLGWAQGRKGWGERMGKAWLKSKREIEAKAIEGTKQRTNVPWTPTLQYL